MLWSVAIRSLWSSHVGYGQTHLYVLQVFNVKLLTQATLLIVSSDSSDMCFIPHTDDTTRYCAFPFTVYKIIIYQLHVTEH